MFVLDDSDVCLFFTRETGHKEPLSKEKLTRAQINAVKYIIGAMFGQHGQPVLYRPIDSMCYLNYFCI